MPQAAQAADSKADSSEKAKVAVGAFEGAKSDEVRSAFIDALKKDGNYEVTDAEDVKASSKGSAIADAAKGLGVNFIITGKVSKGFGLKLKVLGANGKQLDEAEIKGGALPKLKSNIEKTGVSSVADALGKPQKAKPSEDKKDDKKDDEDKPAAASDEDKKDDEDKPAEDKPADSGSGGGQGLSPLDLTAGLRPMNRTFTFHQTIADVKPMAGYLQLLKYELPLGPALFIDLNWFPASHFMTGPAEWIGLTGGFEKGFAITSVFQEGTPQAKTLKTNEQAFYVGPRFRLPIGAHMLGLTGTFGQHSFILEGDEAGPLVPDVKYTYVKAGLDGLFRFGDFLVGARVGKRFVMKTGSLQTVWFPHVKTQSLEAGITVGYRLVSMLDLVAGFDWLRYGFDFNPNPVRCGPNSPVHCAVPTQDTTSYVAGGAVDQYMSGFIGFRFHMPGGSEGEGASQ
ncbi:MAG TPA: hypothetical protein VNG33_01735 [Polyangiaceae bacterium]|nr:hypothetical protein [Polyangiaceae bacterium]